MLRRISIAINLDNKNKKLIYNKISKVPFLEDAIRKVKYENYHLPLCFLGDIKDEDLGNACFNLKESLTDLDIFDLNFNKLEWGPKPENPKMLWLTGVKNDDLINLRFQIEKILSNSTIALEKKDFSPYINLGRIISSFRKEHKVLPRFEQDVNILVPVFSADIMESYKEDGEKKNCLLDSVELG